MKEFKVGDFVLASVAHKATGDRSYMDKAGKIIKVTKSHFIIELFHGWSRAPSAIVVAKEDARLSKYILADQDIVDLTYNKQSLRYTKEQTP